MPIPFEGFVLRAPRIASSNSPTTAEGSVFVRPQDRATYLSSVAYNGDAVTTEYLVAVHETANLVEPDSITETAQQVGEWVYQFNAGGRSLESVISVIPAPDDIDGRAGLVYYDDDPGAPVSVTWEPARLKINWTKNDADRTRFGYHESFQRWLPLPGSAPEPLGPLPDPDEELLSLPVLEEDVDPTIVLGSPDLSGGTIVPVSVVTATEFEDYLDGTLPIPVGEAVANPESGDLLFAPDLVDDFLNQPVFFYRTSFFPFDASTGAIGTVGNPLYMNPIPEDTESPLIRIAYRSYLRGQHSLTDTTPDPGYDYVWSSDTGRIYLDPDLVAEHEDETVYYDGVYSNPEPVDSYPHEDLGTITLGTPPFTTPGLSFADVSAWDLEHTILYVGESGEAIPEIEVVQTESDFTRATNLPATKAQVALDTGAVRLSASFASANEGLELWAGTTDFPIETGISFRMAPSPIDPANIRGVPDGKGVSRVTNEMLSASIPPGPSFLLNQLPLQDVAGYGDNLFYRILRGPQRRVLEPDLDVMYDFDNRQLRWLERESFSRVIPATTYTVQLPHQVLHDRNASFELHDGSGFEPVEEGDDVLVDLNTGLLTFVERFGTPLFEDVGRLVAPDTLEAVSVDLTGLQIPSDPLKAPLLLIGSDAYRIVAATSTTITTNRDIDLPGSAARFAILEAPEIVFRYSLVEASLRERTVFPFVVQEVGTYAPEGETFEFVTSGTLHSHVLLEPEELGQLGDPITLPPYFQEPEANFEIYREEVLLTAVGTNPAPGEYALAGADLEFHPDDVAAFEGAPIILDPALSDPRPTGSIEILVATREISVPTDLDTPDLRVRALFPEDAYELQGSLLFFREPFRSGNRLFVRYTDGDGNLREEEVGFRVVEHVGSVDPAMPSRSFASGVDVDGQRDVVVKINGHPSRSVSVTGTTINTSSERGGRRIDVSYYALDAQGGEQTVSLLSTPDAPPVLFVEGTSTQTFQGDHTGVLVPGSFLQAGAQSFTVLSSSFDGTQTEVLLSSDVLEELRDPDILVSSSPITDIITVPAPVEDASVGVQKLLVLGNWTHLLQASNILYLDSDPYRIQDSGFSSETGYTRVTLATKLVREYSSPVLQASEYPVYAPDTQVLNTSKLAIPSEPKRLIRFDTNGAGQVVEDFLLEGSGNLILEPALVPAPEPGEIWQLVYTGLRSVGPKMIAGRQFLPRFRATYSRFVNATEENGLLGATLQASFDFNDPDTFYFRAVRLAEYAGEVAERVDLEAAARASSGGPIVSAAGTQPLHQKGNESLIYREADLRDMDRVGREYLRFYNDVVTLFENLLEIVDGRIIGDRDGKFLFRIGPDDDPGGIDPVSGELIPYYVNPNAPGTKPDSSTIEALRLEDQIGYIENFIDDILLVSKKPFRLQIGLPLEVTYEGTFLHAWEPHKFSRFFPEQRQVFTLTLPAQGGGSEYTFREDFRQLLADIQQEGVLSVDGIRLRSASARVTEANRFAALDGNGGEARFFVAMFYDPETGEFTNPTGPGDPIPERWVPAFKVDDHVSMGRVTYLRNPDGTVDQVTDIYAENMIVTSVGPDYLEVRENPDGGDFPTEVVTNPNTITPEIGDTIYTIPRIVDSSFSLGNDVPPFYQTPLDLSVNAADGELINNTLPSTFAALFGQSPILPETFLDLTVSYKNQNLEPARFPALDGGFTDDDGDHKPPYVFPVQDSELQRLATELDANQDVEDQTAEGLVFEGDVVDTITIDAGFDLELLPYPPDEFDLVMVEGLLDGSDSVELKARGVDGTLLQLAAFFNPESNVTLDVNLYTGVGEWGGGQWNDATTDFRIFSGALPGGLTLHVSDGGGGFSEYTVTAVEDGYVETSTPVVEVGPRSYFLSLSVTGASIPSTIDRVEFADVDFTEASGSVEIFNTTRDDGTYIAAGGSDGVLFVQVLPYAPATEITVSVSNAEVVDTGLAAVDVASPILLVQDPLAASVEVGQTLLISSTSINAGRYRIEAINGQEIELDASLLEEGDSTLPDFPITWRVTNPRRFSTYLEDLRSEAIRQRVIYALNTDSPADITPDLTAVSGNPSSPYKDRVTELKDLLLGDPILEVSGADATSPDTLTGPNFEAEGIEAGDFVVIEDLLSDNTGVYLVADVSGTTLTISDQSSFDPDPLVLTTETDIDFDIYRGSQFTPQTYELVLYEYIYVLQIVDRLDSLIRVAKHDPEDFFGDDDRPFEERLGDPSDVTLALHRDFVNDRLDWIASQSPSLRDEIDAILKGREALYDVRYTWIDFRTNLEDGTLQRRRQFAREKDKLRRKQLKDLIKQIST